MNVKDILAKWLKERGYDGLCDDGCGCGVDDGFMPCGKSYEPYGMDQCVPSYLWTQHHYCSNIYGCGYYADDKDSEDGSWPCYHTTKPQAGK